MNHTNAVTEALDRLKREVTVLCEMQETSMPQDADATSIHNRLLLIQSKKVRTSSSILVRAIARERDNQQLQPKEGTSE